MLPGRLSVLVKVRLMTFSRRLSLSLYWLMFFSNRGLGLGKSCFTGFSLSTGTTPSRVKRDDCSRISIFGLHCTSSWQKPDMLSTQRPVSDEMASTLPPFLNTSGKLLYIVRAMRWCCSQPRSVSSLTPVESSSLAASNRL